MKRRILSVLLAVCLVMTLMPIYANASMGPSNKTSGQCGVGVQYSFDEASGTLGIFGSGAMYDVDSEDYSFNSPPWGPHNDKIKKVDIASGVTSIGAGAFKDCVNLVSVSIPSTVTKIGKHAFFNCYNLTNIPIPSGLKEMGEGAFRRTSITGMTIPAGVTFGNAEVFMECDDLISVTFQGKLTEIGERMFCSCDALTTVSFSGGLSGEIKTNAFSYCEKLQEIVIPEGVTYIREYAFDGCSGLKKVSLPDSLIHMEDAFDECVSLTSVTIPKNITYMEGVFSNCENLHDVTMYSDTVSIMENDNFDGCDNLAYVHIIGNAPVTEKEAVFGSYTERENFVIYYDKGTTGWKAPSWMGYEIQVWGEENPVQTGTCGENLTWTLKDGTLTISGTGPMDDYGYMEPNLPEWEIFRNRIKSVVIEEGVTSIGTYAFSHHYSTSGENYKYLTSVTVPSTVTSIGAYAFQDCHALTKVTLAEGLKTIEDSAFNDCDALTEIVLPDSVTYIDGAFQNSLVDIELEIPAAMTVITARAFRESRITSVLIHDKVVAVDSYAFGWCNDISAAMFEGDAPAFGNNAFSQTTVTGYYPAGNETWTEAVLQDYGGTVTWEAYCAKHDYALQEQKEASCTVSGQNIYSCLICGESYTETIPPLGHDYTDAEAVYHAEDKTHGVDCTRCGETKYESCTFGDAVVTTEASLNHLGVKTYTCTVCGGSYEEEFVYRIYGKNRYQTAFSTANALKMQLGVEKFDNVVIASGLQFADALAGSYLAAVKNAPILLVNSGSVAEVAEYVETNLAEGGTVYLLGGSAAVPAEMETALEGLNVKRLSGKNRFGTNLAILEEAGVGDDEILVCTGWGFADSLSASAVGKPILLVNTALTEEQKAFLEESSGRFVIIGGTGAVNAEVQSELMEYGSVARLSGKTRYETSVLVAERFFDAPDAVLLAYGQNFPDGLCGGPLAWELGAPLILCANNNSTAADTYVQENAIAKGAVLGGASLISDATAMAVFTLE